MGGLSTPALSLRGISHAFGATQALSQVSLDFEAGHIYALLGENGAGKSTLMKAVAGALRPQQGTMQLHGAPHTPASPAAARAAGIAMIYQELSLAPHLGACENIFLGLERQHFGLLDGASMRAHATAALTRLGIEGLPLERPVRQLSPALRQMIELARALISEARVFIFDEPTSSLGAKDAAALYAVMRDLRAQGALVLFISHDLDEVMDVADRYVVMRDGAAAGSGLISDTSPRELVAMMAGSDVDHFYTRSPHAPGALVLSSGPLRLHEGEIVGLAGLMGSGRSRLLRSLFASHGWTQGGGLVSEDRAAEGLALSRSIEENISLPSLRTRLISPRQLAARAAAQIAALGIRARGPAQRVRDLSGGNQQKVAFARLLAAESRVLFLDEPTRGIDVRSKAEIYRLIDDAACRGKAVLIASSSLAELKGICDRIHVMRHGVPGEPLNPAAVSHADILQEAFGVITEGAY